jgi:Ser/Thr protein kinase RdoA (MazF antagonist)
MAATMCAECSQWPAGGVARLARRGVILGGVIDVETLLEPWALRPTAVTRPEVGTMSETLLVQTDTARVVLRGHRQPEPALVNFELDVMTAARDAGVPVPAVIRTTSGDRLVKTAGKWWSLQEWVDGAQPPRGHHTHEQARSIGAMLAKVHDALHDVDAPPIRGRSRRATSESHRESRPPHRLARGDAQQGR